MSGLHAGEAAIVAEEQALLDACTAALARARDRARRPSRDPDGSPREILRRLRDDVRETSEDDLPALLHEMSVRQSLLERREEPLPDPGSPYFAHLRVRETAGEDGPAVVKDYLLGHTSFVDTRANLRLVDFRVAPVARIFYRHREGDEYEEVFPGRIAEGVVLARRIVVLRDGAIDRIHAGGMVLERSPGGAFVRRDAAALAAGGTGHAARPGILGVGVGARVDRDSAGSAQDVTALLDADQFAAIEAPPERALVVLGTAGSGKTTVALHRLSRISRREPGRFPLERTRVVVPEEGLSRLTRRLLSPLGMDGSAVQTLDEWAIALARAEFGPKLPRLCLDAPGSVTTLKRSPALFRALRERGAGKIRPTGVTLRRLRRRLAELFTDRVFLQDVVARSDGAVSGSAIEETVRHTLLQLADPVEKELASIVDAARKRALDGRALDDGTPAALAGSVDVEDLPILLFLKALHGGLGAATVAQLVVDEAEDFSPFDLSVLGRGLAAGASITLAGDEAQATSGAFDGWSFQLETLGGGRPLDASTVRLAVSYRCPRPVAELARAVLGASSPSEPVATARDGAPVGFFRFPENDQAALFLHEAVTDLAQREPGASIAVVARDAAEATALFDFFSDWPDARLVVDGDFSFEPGIDVTHVDAVKGLEFDYVVVTGVSPIAYPDGDEGRRRLHVALTRAAHQLWVVAGGEMTPILDFARP